MSSFKSSASALAAVAVVLGLTGYGHATTYSETFDQVSQGCTGGCGIDNSNVVTVQTTSTAGEFLISATLDTGWYFQKDPNGAGHAASLAFSSNATSAFTLSGITSPFTQTFANGAAYSLSPYDMPANGYGVSQGDKNGVYSTVSFDVTTDFTSGTSLAQLTSFINSLENPTDVGGATGTTTGILFVADVQGANGKTGAVGFADECGNVSGTTCPSIGQTPIPGALALFASGLGAMGLLGGRRKRKNNAAIAAA
jgi:hypothetical protein